METLYKSLSQFVMIGHMSAFFIAAERITRAMVILVVKTQKLTHLVVQVEEPATSQKVE